MTELSLRLLGVPEVRLGDQPVALRRRTSVALLGYLAITGRRYPRSMLTGLLAGDASEEQAQKRVSNTLADLRAAVGEHLQVTRQWVEFDRERPHRIDVSEFEAQVAAREEPRAAAAGAAAALDLYRGEFLAGVDLRDAPEFDEWLVGQRERLRLSLIQALQAALKGHLRSGPTSAPAGIAAARRLLELEPWSEDGHQALMVLLARSGQRCAALKQYATYRRVLAEELGIEPPPAAAALAARLRAAPRAVPHNLPERAIPFVGRQAELGLVADRLTDPACRLVTLVGLGGSGKSALAVEVARSFAAPAAGFGEPVFPDGVFVVPLGDASPDASAAPDSPELAAARIGAAVGRAVGVAGGAGGPLAAVAGHLRSRRVLLVVDGMDQHAMGAGALTALLRQSAGVTLLVTSRTRLRLPEETVCDVRGLFVPAGASDLERSDAGRFFLEAAARARPEAPLGPAEHEAAAEVCRLLDGHPLALLVAAGCLRGLSCADLLADLAAGRDLPAASTRDRSAGPHGLRDVLDGAWAALTDAERATLLRLAVLPGRFSRAESAVAGAESAPLLGLVDAGLLLRVDGGGYDMPAMVHRYLTARLEDARAAAPPLRHAPGAVVVAVGDGPPAPLRRPAAWTRARRRRATAVPGSGHALPPFEPARDSLQAWAADRPAGRPDSRVHPGRLDGESRRYRAAPAQSGRAPDPLAWPRSSWRDRLAGPDAAPALGAQAAGGDRSRSPPHR